MLRKITSSEVKTRLESPDEHAILDVSREGDFAKGHLFFASNVPRSLLELRIEQLVPRRDTQIALCAKSEGDAVEAGSVLAAFGYRDVAILAGGLTGWTEDGGRLFSGINVPSKAFGEFVEHAAMTPHIAPQTLKDLLDRGENVVVFDARPFAEYQMMSIPGAINCPGGELVSRFSNNVPSTETLVVVNCAGRTRSIMGAQSLIDARIPNRVVALRDGTMGWHLAGYELEHGQTRRAERPSRHSAEEIRARASAFAAKAGVRVLESADIDALHSSGDGRTIYIFDVRDPAEFAEGHRQGATSAPGGQLLQTLDTFVAVQNSRIVVTDSDGTRAPIIGAWLRQMGKKEIFCSIDTDTQSLGPPSPTQAVQTILSRARRIAVPDAFASVNAGKAVIVDLANSKEYRRAHIPASQFCERHQLTQLMRAIAGGKSIILTSPDGQLAAVAAAEFGPTVEHVVSLEGGTSAWKEAGHPMDAGRGNLPEEPDDVFYRPYDRAGNRNEAMTAYLDWEKDLLDRLTGEPGVAFWRVFP